MATTKTIKSSGGDFTTIQAWWDWVRTQTDPDQIGEVYGSVSAGNLNLAGACSFEDITTGSAHPRLVAASGASYTTGYNFFSNNTKAKLDTITLTTASGAFRHFSVTGLWIKNVAGSLAFTSSVNQLHVLLSKCMVYQQVSLGSITTTGSGFSISFSFRSENSILAGDNSNMSGSITVATTLQADVKFDFLYSIIGKGFNFMVSGSLHASTTLKAGFWNTVEFRKEGVGVSFNNTLGGYSGNGSWLLASYSSKTTVSGNWNASILTAYGPTARYGGSAMSIAQIPGVTKWLTSRETDANFVGSDYSTSDYQVKSGSSLINAGSSSFTPHTSAIWTTSSTDMLGNARTSSTSATLGPYQNSSGTMSNSSSYNGATTAYATIGQSDQNWFFEALQECELTWDGTLQMFVFADPGFPDRKLSIYPANWTAYCQSFNVSTGENINTLTQAVNGYSSGSPLIYTFYGSGNAPDTQYIYNPSYVFPPESWGYPYRIYIGEQNPVLTGYNVPSYVDLSWDAGNELYVFNGDINGNTLTLSLDPGTAELYEYYEYYVYDGDIGDWISSSGDGTFQVIGAAHRYIVDNPSEGQIGWFGPWDVPNGEIIRVIVGVAPPLGFPAPGTTVTLYYQDITVENPDTGFFYYGESVNESNGQHSYWTYHHDTNTLIVETPSGATENESYNVASIVDGYMNLPVSPPGYFATGPAYTAGGNIKYRRRVEGSKRPRVRRKVRQ